MRVMHVDASAKSEYSNSRALSRHFVSLLNDKVPDLDIDYLDVTVDVPPHVTEAFAIATYTPEANRTPEMNATLAHSDALCHRLLAADAVIFAMPMYNWSMPSVFKAYIDNVTRGGLTYKHDEHGRIVGQVKPQKALFITTRGADIAVGGPYEGMDALTPALRAAFGFIGIDDPTFVNAQPLQFADQQARAAALQRAHTELASVAKDWITHYCIATLKSDRAL